MHIGLHAKNQHKFFVTPSVPSNQGSGHIYVVMSFGPEGSTQGGFCCSIISTWKTRLAPTVSSPISRREILVVSRGYTVNRATVNRGPHLPAAPPPGLTGSSTAAGPGTPPSRCTRRTRAPTRGVPAACPLRGRSRCAGRLCRTRR